MCRYFHFSKNGPKIWTITGSCNIFYMDHINFAFVWNTSRNQADFGIRSSCCNGEHAHFSRERPGFDSLPGRRDVNFAIFCIKNAGFYFRFLSRCNDFDSTTTYSYDPRTIYKRVFICTLKKNLKLFRTRGEWVTSVPCKKTRFFQAHFTKLLVAPMISKIHKQCVPHSKDLE